MFRLGLPLTLLLCTAVLSDDSPRCDSETQQCESDIDIDDEYDDLPEYDDYYDDNGDDMNDVYDGDDAPRDSEYDDEEDMDSSADYDPDEEYYEDEMDRERQKIRSHPDHKSIIFRNKSDIPVDLYWDNGKGLGQWVGTVHPGSINRLDSYLGHKFYATKKSYRDRLTKWEVTKDHTDFHFLQEYVKDDALGNDCQDRRDNCEAMAKGGGCTRSPGWMIVNCAKACNKCELRDPKKRCDQKFLNITAPAYQPGSLNKIFSTIVDDYPQYKPRVLSKEPWIIVFDELFSKQEADEIFNSVGPFERSTDTGSMNQYGEAERIMSTGRTSENAWCRWNCENNPHTKAVINRMVEITQIPYENYESFQVLKYSKGQFYRTHHDMSPRQANLACGPRILTFFLYFSDVEEGGETNFPRLDIKVKPKTGRAVLWPSTLDSDPKEQDPRTHHEALPVIKGEKRAANAWIHLQNFKIPNLWGCTGAFD